jgi:alpha-amylase/alpha-mannosidase (GH57 family)
MPHPLYIAFIWHQHQPLYKSVFESDYRLPWVRLHGTKDYLDLVLLLEQFPRLRQTVNLVPSLLLQIDDYVSGRARDPYLNLTLTPGEDLGRSQHRFILEHFFEAHRLTLIDPHPRYRELYDQQHDRGIDWCLEHWTQQDYEDLLTWHNLAWIDPLFWDDPEIAGWLRRGRNFTLSDRQALWRKQQSILQRIIPQHRAMQERGQLEVTTSPIPIPFCPCWQIRMRDNGQYRTWFYPPIASAGCRMCPVISSGGGRYTSNILADRLWACGPPNNPLVQTF